MKNLIPIGALVAMLSTSAWAADKTVTLSIPGMTCGACPITVRTALDRVTGVEKVGIDEAQKLVTVTYDDSKTNAQALTNATKDAGYPSSVEP
jgi:mercuric ion binding protein